MEKETILTEKGMEKKSFLMTRKIQLRSAWGIAWSNATGDMVGSIFYKRFFAILPLSTRKLVLVQILNLQKGS